MAMTKVPTRKLGKYGPEVSALGYGCMGLSSFYGKPRPDEERLKFLDHIYAAGETHWDSADIYGDSEDLLGKYVSRRFLFTNSNMPLLCLRWDAASLESATSSRAKLVDHPP
jgi:predicted aldo/keto reductase-like oxidoreductase